MQSQTSEEIKRIIKSELPHLIQSDPDMRRFILDVTHKRYADRTETESRFDRILNELKTDREARDRKWGDQEKKWEENQKVINDILDSIKALHTRIDSSIGALGARWGLRSEGAFRTCLPPI